MKRSGCSQSKKGNVTECISTTNLNIDNTKLKDDGIVLFATSADTPAPYVQLDVCATRNGTNHLLMTWNAELVSGCTMYKIHRILTPNNPANISWANEWYIDDSPTNILNGLGSCNNKRISVSDGDLYEEWVDADLYDGYYVTYLFIYQLDDLYYGMYWYAYAKITNYCIANSPTISYNQSSNNFTIGTSMSGRRILEFYRKDRAYGYPTSISNQDTLNEMLLASIINEEGGAREFYSGYYYANDNVLERWDKGKYTVGVNFRDNTNKTRISNAINSALSEINSVLNSHGVYFTRSSTATSGDITITVDTEYNLYGLDPFEEGAYVYGGTWETETNSNGYIESAHVKLANDFFDGVPYNTYEHVALEELSQAMGAGYDQYEYTENTIHIDFNYLNKPKYLTTNDKNILHLVYSDAVNVGDDCTKVSKSLNIPKGVYQPSRSTSNTTMTVSASFLDSDASYAVRVFIVNSDGEISYTSNWINITTPNIIRPENWEWTTTISSTAYVPVDSLGFHPVTAVEWNNFTKRINEFREYTGYSDYSFSTVSRGQEFTPVIYNQAVNAIKGISGYGSYLSTISTGTKLSANLFLSLRDELNAIP